MTPQFTARQGEYLAFIHGYTLRCGVAPSFDDIAGHFGTTTPSVNGMIKSLEVRGLLSRVPGAARSLRVLVPPSLLPRGDYGAGARRAAGSRPATATVSPEDAAVAAAVAVLDVLMPKLLPALPPEAETAQPVMEAARAVRKALAQAGVDPDQVDQATRRIGAEAARWRQGGITIPSRRWVLKPKRR